MSGERRGTILLVGILSIIVLALCLYKCASRSDDVPVPVSASVIVPQAPADTVKTVTGKDPKSRGRKRKLERDKRKASPMPDRPSPFERPVDQPAE